MTGAASCAGAGASSGVGAVLGAGVASGAACVAEEQEEKFSVHVHASTLTFPPLQVEIQTKQYL